MFCAFFRKLSLASRIK